VSDVPVGTSNFNNDLVDDSEKHFVRLAKMFLIKTPV